jgi:hypothetical protein
MDYPFNIFQAYKVLLMNIRVIVEVIIMNETKQIDFSDDETINKAIEFVKVGLTFEEVQIKFNLTDNDIYLIDLVLNEL